MVGSYVAITLLIDVTTPVALTLGRLVAKQIHQLRWLAQRKLTQEDANRVFEGRHLSLAPRLAGILTQLFVAVMYAAGAWLGALLLSPQYQHTPTYRSSILHPPDYPPPLAASP